MSWKCDVVGVWWCSNVSKINSCLLDGSNGVDAWKKSSQWNVEWFSSTTSKMNGWPFFLFLFILICCDHLHYFWFRCRPIWDHFSLVNKSLWQFDAWKNDHLYDTFHKTSPLDMNRTNAERFLDSKWREEEKMAHNHFNIRLGDSATVRDTFFIRVLVGSVVASSDWLFLMMLLLFGEKKWLH